MLRKMIAPILYNFNRMVSHCAVASSVFFSAIRRQTMFIAIDMEIAIEPFEPVPGKNNVHLKYIMA
ncbi:MAG: hypothetical protein A3F43_05440 [Gammaproteobacteria bacterium RIFCSPHIGHO2_12_FULL_42_10]|nr:MAG: hypothetical protein A3F43_05440 [Gammaproteobacteria bacterium RIFCSPHIGHO2_12_FULL_42_10]